MFGGPWQPLFDSGSRRRGRYHDSAHRPGRRTVVPSPSGWFDTGADYLTCRGRTLHGSAPAGGFKTTADATVELAKYVVSKAPPQPDTSASSNG